MPFTKDDVHNMSWFQKDPIPISTEDKKAPSSSTDEKGQSPQTAKVEMTRADPQKSLATTRVPAKRGGYQRSEAVENSPSRRSGAWKMLTLVPSPVTRAFLKAGECLRH